MTTVFVLLAFSVNLFGTIRCRAIFILCLIRVASESSLLAFTFKHVSSAYKTDVDLERCHLRTLKRITGPRPCGTSDLANFTD